MMKRFMTRLLFFVGSLLVLCGCGKEEEILIFSSSSDADLFTSETENLTLSQEEKLLVYVCGAVEQAGVVELESTARVIDAITLAGGMLPEADETYLNLAGKLTDGEKIYVPTRAETARWAEEASQDDLVNINTADIDELCTLSGIGESKAEDIIAYREKHGSFKQKEELMNISGIKESLFEKIADKIKIE